MGQEGDDRLSLPVPPPPNPAARRAAIDVAMRKFDGLGPAPPPRPAFSLAKWVSTHRAATGGLVTATLIAIVSIPVAQVVIGDRQAEVAPAGPLPEVRNEPAFDAVADNAVEEAPQAAPGLIAAPAQLAPPSPAVAAPAPAVVGYIAGMREEKAQVAAPAPVVMRAAPPPPAPPPPPPAEPEERASDAGNIVVTGSRVRQQNLESLSPVSVVSRDEIGDTFGTFLSRLQDKFGGGDRNAVLGMVGLPLRVSFGGENRTYRTRADVERDYDRIFTSKVTDALIGTYSDQLQSRDGGKLKGNGSIWFGCGLRVCESADTIKIREVHP